MSLPNSSRHYRYDIPERRKALDQRYRSVVPVKKRRHADIATNNDETLVRTAPSLAIVTAPYKTRAYQEKHSKSTTQEEIRCHGVPEKHTRFVTLCLFGAIAMCALLYAALSISACVQNTYAHYTLGQYPTAQATTPDGETHMIATIIDHSRLVIIVIDAHDHTESTTIALIDKSITISGLTVRIDDQHHCIVTLTTGFNVWPTQRQIDHTYTLTWKNDHYTLQ